LQAGVEHQLAIVVAKVHDETNSQRLVDRHATACIYGKPYCSLQRGPTRKRAVSLC